MIVDVAILLAFIVILLLLLGDFGEVQPGPPKYSKLGDDIGISSSLEEIAKGIIPRRHLFATSRNPPKKIIPRLIQIPRG